MGNRFSRVFGQHPTSFCIRIIIRSFIQKHFSYAHILASQMINEIIYAEIVKLTMAVQIYRVFSASTHYEDLNVAMMSPVSNRRGSFVRSWMK